MKSSKATEGLACLESRKQPATLVIILRPVGMHGNFSASLDSTMLVKKSSQPEFNAARALHKRGYEDKTLLIFRHYGSEIDAMRGTLGVWRKLRVREDSRTGPRFAKYEPFPSAKVDKRRTRR